MPRYYWENHCRKAVIGCILFYQRVFSWDHQWRHWVGGMRLCRWYPSCSDYALQVWARETPWNAATLTLKRVLRCNPWSKGGVDE